MSFRCSLVQRPPAGAHRLAYLNIIWLLIKLVVPIPPRETVNGPDDILDAFKAVKPLPFTDIVPEVILEAFKFVNEAPEPEKRDAGNVFDILFHVKLDD
jgi:hypothetical protein